MPSNVSLPNAKAAAEPIKSRRFIQEKWRLTKSIAAGGALMNKKRRMTDEELASKRIRGNRQQGERAATKEELEHERDGHTGWVLLATVWSPEVLQQKQERLDEMLRRDKVQHSGHASPIPGTLEKNSGAATLQTEETAGGAAVYKPAGAPGDAPAGAASLAPTGASGCGTSSADPAAAAAAAKAADQIDKSRVASRRAAAESSLFDGGLDAVMICTGSLAEQLETDKVSAMHYWLLGPELSCRRDQLLVGEGERGILGGLDTPFPQLPRSLQEGFN
jgi:hypothetical protein